MDECKAFVGERAERLDDSLEDRTPRQRAGALSIHRHARLIQLLESGRYQNAFEVISPGLRADRAVGTTRDNRQATSATPAAYSTPPCALVRRRSEPDWRLTMSGPGKPSGPAAAFSLGDCDQAIPKYADAVELHISLAAGTDRRDLPTHGGRPSLRARRGGTSTGPTMPSSAGRMQVWSLVMARSRQTTLTKGCVGSADPSQTDPEAGQAGATDGPTRGKMIGLVGFAKIGSCVRSSPMSRLAPGTPSRAHVLHLGLNAHSAVLEERRLKTATLTPAATSHPQSDAVTRAAQLCALAGRARAACGVAHPVDHNALPAKHSFKNRT
jgi:hypothetical protein